MVALNPLDMNRAVGSYAVRSGAVRSGAQKLCPRAAQLVVYRERFRATWKPVRVKKTHQNKKLELRF